MNASEATKAIGVAVTGVLAWASVVVASPSAAITASEWLALGGVGATTLACFGLTNAQAGVELTGTLETSSGNFGSTINYTGPGAGPGGAPPAV